jgi:hypothetical protein
MREREEERRRERRARRFCRGGSDEGGSLAAVESTREEEKKRANRLPRPRDICNPLAHPKLSRANHRHSAHPSPPKRPHIVRGDSITAAIEPSRHRIFPLHSSNGSQAVCQKASVGCCCHSHHSTLSFESSKCIGNAMQGCRSKC